MTGAKIVVLYPAPKDMNEFERAYGQEHVPMVSTQNFKGMKSFTASKIVGTPDGSAPPFHRMAELHFSSMADLKAAAGSPTAQPVVAHAFSISSGGPPVVLIVEEETRAF